MPDQRQSARDTLRVIAQQDADGVFLLRDLSLQIRNGGVRSIEDLLRLEHISPRPGWCAGRLAISVTVAVAICNGARSGIAVWSWRMVVPGYALGRC